MLKKKKGKKPHGFPPLARAPLNHMSTLVYSPTRVGRRRRMTYEEIVVQRGYLRTRTCGDNSVAVTCK